ncbi:hypothetical protein PQR37_37450 [Paraburkholderia nemoris]|uniref:hypothetical protein n=1 Tax=Paraburkholderia nemoris TaxID=2793076 RepID=UPI0038B7CC07
MIAPFESGPDKRNESPLSCEALHCPLSPTNLRQVMLIFNVMFAWRAGPAIRYWLSRQRARLVTLRIACYLSVELWFEVETWIQAMPKETAPECEHYSRVRWLFTP